MKLLERVRATVSIHPNLAIALEEHNVSKGTSGALCRSARRITCWGKGTNGESQHELLSMVSFTEPQSRAQCPSKAQFPHSLPQEKNGTELGRAAHCKGFKASLSQRGSTVISHVSSRCCCHFKVLTHLTQVSRIMLL